jgi:hypothetical protein
MSKDLKNFADRIKHMVRDFVNTGDISRINRDVTITVNSALETAFEEVRKAVDSIRAGTRFNEDKSASSFARQPWYPRYGEMKQQPRQAAKFPHVPVGRVAGILYAVSGGVGLGLLGVVTALLFAFGTVNLINAVGLAAFFVACVSLEIKGSVIRNRLRRYKKYLGLLDGRTSCMIKELAIYSGHSEKFILKDFRKMISLGMFPQAHIDDEKTLIMLNNEVYERYLAYQAEYKVRKARELEEQESGKKKPATGTGPEIRNAVEEGRKYIRQIREAKFDISNAAVSAKIQRLEGTIGKII